MGRRRIMWERHLGRLEPERNGFPLRSCPPVVREASLLPTLCCVSKPLGPSRLLLALLSRCMPGPPRSARNLAAVPVATSQTRTPEDEANALANSN